MWSPVHWASIRSFGKTRSNFLASQIPSFSSQCRQQESTPRKEKVRFVSQRKAAWQASCVWLCLIALCTHMHSFNQQGRKAEAWKNQQNELKQRQAGPVTCVNHLLSLEGSCIFSQICSLFPIYFIHYSLMMEDLLFIQNATIKNQQENSKLQTLFFRFRAFSCLLKTVSMCSQY